MALAVLAAGGLRAVLPAQLRAGDSRWLVAAVVVAYVASARLTPGPSPSPSPAAAPGPAGAGAVNP